MKVLPTRRAVALALFGAGAPITGFVPADAAHASAQEPVRYDVRFPNAAHHEARIELIVRDLEPGPVDLWMSRSSPGRYALHEFAKNVYALRVTDLQGTPVPVRRPDPYHWRVEEHGGALRIAYTLFADRADGTYSQIDRSHAHLNMPSAFLWVRGLEGRPIRIRFHPPDGTAWTAATQLFPVGDSLVYTAPDLAYFLDSPTELSEHHLVEWELPTDLGRGRIRLAVHHLGTEAEVRRYADAVRRIVEEEIAVFGEPAPYDGGTYTFIADYLPWASGDGMEHRNSTILTNSGSLARDADRLIGTVAHEFFHSWNVERLRPRSLEPFDFTRANPSRELWFAEGFTSYYTDLILRRAGRIDDAEYGRRIARRIDALWNAPGRRFFSPEEMSLLAPFVDAATSVDPTNRQNTFLSYYTWGAVLGLALDLRLRERFGTDLDAFMRRLWRSHGVSETPYTAADLERALAEETGDAVWAGAFFDRFVRGREVPDLAPLLARAGFLLRRARPEAAWLGDARLEMEAEGARLVTGTRIGSPLYEAGLDRGDVIAAVDGQPLRSAGALEALLEAREPGDTLAVEFRERGIVPRRVRVVLGEDPAREVVPFEEAGRVPDAEVRRFREAWLGGRR